MMEASDSGGVELSIYTRDNDSSRETILGTVVNKGMVICCGKGEGFKKVGRGGKSSFTPTTNKWWGRGGKKKRFSPC